MEVNLQFSFRESRLCVSFLNLELLAHRLVNIESRRTATGRDTSGLDLQATKMAPKNAKAMKSKQKPQDEQREESLQAVVSRLASGV